MKEEENFIEKDSTILIPLNPSLSQMEKVDETMDEIKGLLISLETGIKV